MRQRYVEAVCHEIERRRTEQEVGTIYMGGGTPSQLTMAQLRQLLESVRRTHTVAADAEVTVEVNPDDVTAEMADGLRAIGVNRVSMGAQTSDDQRLRFLNRRHTASQVTTAVVTLRQAGFDNVSIDLMYGFPDETLDDWRRDIDAALQLDVEHISAYCLMVEEGTPLHEQYKMESGKSRVDEEVERAMYYELADRLTGAGYEHYELSNFARPGRRSRHNSSYWKDVPYIGVGAAAHSYDGKRRSWNVSDLEQYIKGIESGHPHYEWEELDADTHYNDRITVALRTCEGLRLSGLTDKQRNYLISTAKRFLVGGLLEINDDHIKLTREGLFVSDMVMSELMIV